MPLRKVKGEDLSALPHSASGKEKFLRSGSLADESKSLKESLNTAETTQDHKVEADSKRSHYEEHQFNGKSKNNFDEQVDYERSPGKNNNEGAELNSGSSYGKDEGNGEQPPEKFVTTSNSREENENEEEPLGNNEGAFGNSWDADEQNDVYEQVNKDGRVYHTKPIGDDNEMEEHPEERNDEEKVGNNWPNGEENDIDEKLEGNNEEEFGNSWDENEIHELPEGNGEEEFGKSWASSEENEIDERQKGTVTGIR